MDENTPKQNPFVIMGLIALIIVLFIGIKLVFAFLGAAIPQTERTEPAPAPEQSVSDSLPAPSYCPHCGEKLPEDFQWGWFCPYCGEMTET